MSIMGIEEILDFGTLVQMLQKEKRLLSASEEVYLDKKESYAISHNSSWERISGMFRELPEGPLEYLDEYKVSNLSKRYGGHTVMGTLIDVILEMMVDPLLGTQEFQTRSMDAIGIQILRKALANNRGLDVMFDDLGLDLQIFPKDDATVFTIKRKS